MLSLRQITATKIMLATMSTKRRQPNAITMLLFVALEVSAEKERERDDLRIAQGTGNFLRLNARDRVNARSI